MKLKFILLALVILASDLVAEAPIPLGGGEGPGESLYAEDFEELEAPFEEDNIKPLDKNVQQQQQQPIEENTLQLPATKTEPAPAVSQAYAKFADKPSTGPGSNKLDLPTLEPEPANRTVLGEQHHRPAPSPIHSVQNTKEQLEEAVKRCADEINNLYADQKKVPREKRQQFQCNIGRAHENCEKMRKELDAIKLAEENRNKAEINGKEAMQQYEDNMKLVKETTTQA